jgi:protocatechuate 3,4-dioxygenase beta subunit
MTTHQARRVTLMIALVTGVVAHALAQTAGAPPARVTAPQAPARDTAGPAATTGTSSVRGRVTDAATGRPLRRATVTATLLGRFESRAATSNDDGAYELRDLPAGELTLSVRKPGYVTSSYGGARNDPSSRKVIRLADRERLDRADIAIERGGVIMGRVTDDYGEPVLDASVQVFRRTFVQGRPRLSSVDQAVRTNDIGEYRAFGLAPGDYFVSASLPLDFNRSLADDASGYAPSYYPGTPEIAEAQAVRVSAGGDTPADIALQAVRLGRVAGMLLEATGRPALRGQIVAARADDNGPLTPGSVLESTHVNADGTFTLKGLAPGRYVLQGMPGAYSVGTTDADMAEGVVTIGPGDTQPVTLLVTRAGTVRGRLAVEGRPLTSFAGLRVAAQGVGPRTRISAPPIADVSPDGTFEITGVRGLVRLRLAHAGSASGRTGPWLTSVHAGANDVTESGVEVAAGRTLADVEVRVVRDTAEVNGTVTDADGHAVSDYVVVFFHDDEQAWHAPVGRPTGMERPDDTGRYTAPGLFAGTYLVIALKDVDSTRLGDPELFNGLRSLATETRIGDGEKKIVDLRLVVQ